MHQEGNYQDFIKKGGIVFRSFLQQLNELEGFFPKICNLIPPNISHKRVRGEH